MFNFDFNASIIPASIIDGNHVLHFIVSREEIENKRMGRVITQMTECMKAGKKAKGNLIITVFGYDDDPRELAEIPEVRSFFRTAYEYFPNIFEYLVPSFPAVNPILFCLLDTIATDKHAGKFRMAIVKNQKNMELINKVECATGLSYKR